MVLALQQLAQIRFEVGDLDASRKYLDRAIKKARRLRDQDLVGLCLFRLGAIALVEHRWPEAHDCLLRSIECARAKDDVEQQAIALALLGRWYLGTGQPEAATIALKDSLRTWGHHGSPRQLAMIVQSLGAVAAAQGDIERAARLVGAATTMRRATDVKSTSPLQLELDAQVQPILDNAEASLALTEGQAMEPLMVVRYALGEGGY
jgi:tetratricopeptide (TPR) repeat protein